MEVKIHLVRLWIMLVLEASRRNSQSWYKPYFILIYPFVEKKAGILKTKQK